MPEVEEAGPKDVIHGGPVLHPDPRGCSQRPVLADLLKAPSRTARTTARRLLREMVQTRSLRVFIIPRGGVGAVRPVGATERDGCAATPLWFGEGRHCKKKGELYHSKHHVLFNVYLPLRPFPASTLSVRGLGLRLVCNVAPFCLSSCGMN